MFANISWKNLLMRLGVLAFVVGSTSPAMAGRNGIYWYVNQTTVTVTLINLTDYPLTATDTSAMVTGGANCLAYPFQHGVSVAPYSTAIWKTSVTSNITWYSGKITFLPTGIDPKWSFDLNFSAVDISYMKKYGTWVYLSATDTSNIYGWYPGWLDLNQEVVGHWGLYSTPLVDTHMHNQMNLLGSAISVSMFSGNNNDVTIVVKQMSGTFNGTPDPYVGWKLNWVDNDGNDFP